MQHIIPEKQVDKRGVLHFFIENQAINRDIPAKDDDPVAKFSRDPNDVGEIKAIRKMSIREMEDDELIKHYHRIVGKQKHVFSKRSLELQRIVDDYLIQYSNEIMRRRKL